MTHPTYGSPTKACCDRPPSERGFKARERRSPMSFTTTSFPTWLLPLVMIGLLLMLRFTRTATPRPLIPERLRGEAVVLGVAGVYAMASSGVLLPPSGLPASSPPQQAAAHDGTLVGGHVKRGPRSLLVTGWTVNRNRDPVNTRPSCPASVMPLAWQEEVTCPSPITPMWGAGEHRGRLCGYRQVRPSQGSCRSRNAPGPGPHAHAACLQ